jgi:glucuronate isomerase
LKFLDDSFLLNNKTAQRLYREYAATQRIFDYHSHLPVSEIAENRAYSSITEAWLVHDHYKWRAMRANGVDERYITGDASDLEKFLAWAETVPRTMRNPLYHWTHMELKHYFNMGNVLLDRHSAEEIFRRCNELLQTEPFMPRSILERMNVKWLCTTNDPTESLDHHLRLRDDKACSVAVLPTFRPDSALQIENPESFKAWVLKLGKLAGIEIRGFDAFLQALQERHDAFHEAGCRASDHGLERVYTESYTESEVRSVFKKVLRGELPADTAVRKFKTCMIAHFSWMDSRRNWVQMLHLGALRNNNTCSYNRLGPDSGFDAMGDLPQAKQLITFLDRLEQGNMLPKTVLFNINPGDSDLFVSIAGCFQDSSVPGKIQIGPPWWFNDHRDGIIAHLNALSNGGLLSRFIGMTTDSRSILSFPRHDYFRRILCNLLGEEMERGELPSDMELMGGMVKDICLWNAAAFFSVNVKAPSE